MRLRTLLATAVAGTLIAGVTGASAGAASVPSPARAGSVVAWGNAAAAGDVLNVPTDLGAPVAKLAANGRATAAVTTDGRLRVWGPATAAEVSMAPAVTDATSVALAMNAGAVLHADGTISAWGPNPAFTDDIPSTLRAKAIAITPTGTGYAVRTDGTLTTWGANPSVPLPTTGLTGLVDIASGTFQAVALRADGTVAAWGYESEEEGVTGFNTVPDFGGKKATQITAGTYSNGAVLEDGTIRTWGYLPIDGQPDLTGKKVISLDLSTIAAAVTDDGAVHTWGGAPDVDAIPASLTGKPVASVVVGSQHAVAIVTSFRELTRPTIAGSPQVGTVLTATPATFSLAPDASASGQWYAGSGALAGQTGTRLTLTAAHVGKAISYRSTATRGSETLHSTSLATAAVKPLVVVPPRPPVKATSKVSAKVKASGKTKKLAKKVKVTITVRTAPRVSAKGKLTLVLKGKTKKKVSVSVNAQGKATVTLKKIKRGKYTATLKYAGNAGVKASTVAKRFKV